MTIAAVGAIILWFGWYGFNPGSTLSAMDYQGVARVAANTTLAACTGGLFAMMGMYVLTKKWDCGMTLNGLLAGLVAITCPCYWVSPFGAMCIGAVAGIVVIIGVEMLEYLRIDDPVGAWPVHGLAGMWGTWSLGLFATGEYGASTPTGADNTAASVVTGLFYHGGTNQLVAQIIGNLSIGVGVFVALAGDDVRAQGVRCPAGFPRGRTRRPRRARATRGIAYPEAVLKGDETVGHFRRVFLAGGLDGLLTNGTA